MTKVDGPRPTPPAGGDSKSSANEPRKGEFDQVLGQQQGQGAQGVATALPTALRGPGARNQGQGGGPQGDPAGGLSGALASLFPGTSPPPAGSGLQTRARAAGTIDLGGPVGGSVPLGGTPAQLAGAQAEARRVVAPGPEGEAAALRRRTDDELTLDPAGAGVGEAQGGLVSLPMPAPDAPTTPAVDAQAMRLLADKLGAAMDLHLAADRPQLSIGLDLGALGQGQVSIERTADGVTVAFQLASPESASFLAERLPHLEQALNDRGITVAQLDAGVGSREIKAGGSEGAGGQGTQGDGQRDRRGDGQSGDGRSRGRFEVPSEEQT